MSHVPYEIVSQTDLLLFARGLEIPSAHGLQLFDDCMQPFQRESFSALAPSLKAIQKGDPPPVRRFWIERTKKAGKDSDLAVCLLWLMVSTTRPILVQVCAANQKQARIVEDRAVEIVHHNPWLNDWVEIIQSCIRSKEFPRQTRVQIEATGSAGEAQGPTPDLLVLNELVHVDKWKVMEAHMNNADGVPQGVVIVSTNAGIKGKEAHVWRQNALRKGSRWKVLLWSDKSPWVNDEDVAEAKRRDPAGAEYKRLWEGKWISGRGTAMSDEDLEKCFIHSGPLKRPEPGWNYLEAFDLGVSHDHAGIVILGVNREEQRIRVARLKGYEPVLPNDKGGLEVDLDAVERACEGLSKRFGVEWFGYDPAAGGSFMAQRLRKKGLPMREVAFGSPTNLTEMAVSLVQAVKEGKLECYDDPEGRLRRDFGKFDIVHRPPNRYKLEAVSDEFGHADVGTALAICLPKAVEMLGGWGSWGVGEVLAARGEVELTEEEEKEMDPFLREMMEEEDAASEDQRLDDAFRDWGREELF